MTGPRIFKEATEFSQFIEQQALKQDQTCLETVIQYIEDRDIDMERMKNLIAPSLKSKLMNDFMELGMIKGENDISEFLS